MLKLIYWPVYLRFVKDQAILSINQLSLYVYTASGPHQSTLLFDLDLFAALNMINKQAVVQLWDAYCISQLSITQLIAKLQTFHIHGTELQRNHNYLMDRSQYVSSGP